MNTIDNEVLAQATDAQLEEAAGDPMPNHGVDMWVDDLLISVRSPSRNRLCSRAVSA